MLTSAVPVIRLSVSVCLWGLLQVLAGPGGAGGPLKPSDLASHMILVARAKQQTSSLRSAVNTAQQQLEVDRDAAASAAREAAKVCAFAVMQKAFACCLCLSASTM